MDVLPPGSFPDQILRPWGQEQPKGRALAWTKTIFLGICSIGLVQAGCGLYALWLGRHIKPKEKESGVTAAAKKVFPGPSEVRQGSPGVPSKQAPSEGRESPTLPKRSPAPEEVRQRQAFLETPKEDLPVAASVLPTTTLLEGNKTTQPEGQPTPVEEVAVAEVLPEEEPSIEEPPALEKEVGLEMVNTVFFLQRPPSEAVLRAASAEAERTLKASRSSTKLSELEWLTALRAHVVLTKGPVSPELRERMTELLVRYDLSHRRDPQEVPPMEFCDLYEFLQGPEVDTIIGFFRESFQPVELIDDPNAVRAFAQLTEEARVSDWRSGNLLFEGVEKPWQNFRGSTDRQKILSLLRDLEGKGPEELAARLNDLSFGLLFILTAHTLNPHEWGECRKAFLKIDPQLDGLRLYLRKNPPSTEAEGQAARNFLRLFFFLRGSTLKERLPKDVPGQPILSGGNIAENCTIGDLTSHLMAARDEYAKDERAKRAATVSFSQGGLVPFPELVERGVGWWGEVFYEGGTWGSRQQRAREELLAIEGEIQKFPVPFDFPSIVEAIQNGESGVESFLKRFPDHGLSFLKEYVYPACVLKNVLEAKAGDSEARFLSCAASPDEVCNLGGRDPEGQISTLKNVVWLMGRGGLARSAIHSSQIDMLRMMTSSIERRKPVYVCNETGTGKTTMARLAPQIVSLKVPIVLHVAPFPQAEAGWTTFTQWSDLDAIGEGPTPHLCITAASLAQLLQQGVPKKYTKLLQDSFWVLDEYDDESYRYAGRSIQDELSAHLGCCRLCNMSATPNLETWTTAIARYEQKQKEVSDASKREAYQGKIDQLVQRREALLQSMANTWRRKISFEFTGSKGIDGQVAEVFEKLRSEPFVQDRRGSVLVEMPRFTVTPDFIAALRIHMEQLLPNGPSALLVRSSDGRTRAHVYDGSSWNELPLEDYLLHYASIDEGKRPPTICLYSQDSVGGDFGLLSHEKAIRSQHIVYSGPISPSYAIYQHMRRLRTSGGSAPSAIPVTVYLGEEAQSTLPVGDADATLKRFFEQAQTTADALYRQEETGRLKTKILRKKEGVVRAMLEEDKKSLHQHFEGSELKELQERVDAFVDEAMAHNPIGVEEEVASARKRILKEVVAKLCGTEPNEETKRQLQKWESYKVLYDVFPKKTEAKEIKTDYIYEKSPPKDYFALIETFVRKNYVRPESDQCIDVLLPRVRKKASFPISEEVLSEVLTDRSLRGDNNQPPFFDIRYPPEPNSKVAPTIMIEALIGANFRDSARAKKYLDGLEAGSKRAEKERADYEHKQQQIAQAKESLLQEIDKLDLEPTSFRKTSELEAQPQVSRALQRAQWYERRLSAV